jgi:hypothetical protein
MEWCLNFFYSAQLFRDCLAFKHGNEIIADGPAADEETHLKLVANQAEVHGTMATI